MLDPHIDDSLSQEDAYSLVDGSGTSSGMNLLDLPVELIYSIIFLLDLDNVVKCRLVSVWKRDRGLSLTFSGLQKVRRNN